MTRHVICLRFGLGVLLGLLAVLVGGSPVAGDDTDNTFARVEEDWQLVVNSPDENNNGPQVTCVIAPSTLDQGYCAIDLNYSTQPDYSPGGGQMHVWNPSNTIAVNNLAIQGQLSAPRETITWTQSMALNGSTLTFGITNGQSTSWGAFGGDDATLSVSTSNPTLAGYSPGQSTQNSGVSFASNLVTSLTLVTVRYYNAGGQLIRTDSTPRSVVQSN